MTIKGANKGRKADEAAPAKTTRKRKEAAKAALVKGAKTSKKAAVAAKEAAKELATAEAAAAAGKPTATFTRTKKPSAVVVGSPQQSQPLKPVKVCRYITYPT